MGLDEFIPDYQTLLDLIKSDLILFIIVFFIFTFIFNSLLIGGILTILFVIIYPHISKTLHESSSAAGNIFSEVLSSFFSALDSQSNHSNYGRTYGNGSISIKNGSGRHARVYLTPAGTKKAIKDTFISAGGEGYLSGIGEGSYTLYFAFFDEKRNIVARQQFENTLNFTNSSSSGSTRYSVTLHPVAGGNARTYSVDERDFPT